MDIGTRYASSAREIRNYRKLMEGTAAGPSKIIGRDRTRPSEQEFQSRKFLKLVATPKSRLRTN